jgi:hypothetical protein
MPSRHFSLRIEASCIYPRSSRKHTCFFRRYAIFTLLFLFVALVSSAVAQQPILTSRGDTTRSGANTNETVLTPSNVNTVTFGHLFSVPIDYQALAQPLFVPNVSIGGQLHNVVYVVTQTDSVYSIDADNGASLWTANMLNGGVPASGKYLPCGTLGGFAQEGIVGTPVIDPNTNTMYLVAKTLFNATVYHYLHALDITTGIDVAPPVQITATSTSNKGHVTIFNSLHQKNRPGLLLQNGTLYMGFGSNGCNDHNSGWVLAYDVSNQQNIKQTGVFNTSPDTGLTSIWQTGNGLTADELGNVYVSTAESSNYDVPAGGQSFSNSVLKLSPAPWTASPSQPQLVDYFTPASVAYLNAHDLDVSSVGPLVLPDLAGSYPHEVLASSKQGIVWVLNRDDMGWYSAAGDNIIQEFTLITNGELMCSPAYWNGTVYFLPDGTPLQAYQVSNGLWTPSAQTAKRYNGASSPAVSANGNTNGIVWEISGTLNAFDAVSLELLYTSPTKLPKIAHFATPTVANGKVYVATQTSLEAYGLLNLLSVASGNNQTAQVMQPLPQPLKIVATNYASQPQAGVTVTFSDGGKGGSFNPPTAVTDSGGTVSTVYTLPQVAGTYTLTASSPNFASVTATETATAAVAATKLIIISGTHQTGAEGSVLAKPLVVEVQDANKNPVSGVAVQFKPATDGVVNPASAVTNVEGLAQTNFQLPTVQGIFTVSASTTGAKNVSFSETSVMGTPAGITVTGGNNQTQAVKTTLRNALTVLVTDQYDNPVSGVAVTFSDNAEGGSFSNKNPVYTNSTGTTWQAYTLPPVGGTFKVTATAVGVATPAIFTEVAQ